MQQSPMHTCRLPGTSLSTGGSGGGDTAEQPTWCGDGHGVGTLQAGAGPAVEQHPPPLRHWVREVRIVPKAVFSSRESTSDERESDPATPGKANKERSEARTAQKKHIEGSSFLTHPLVTTALSGHLQSQRKPV